MKHIKTFENNYEYAEVGDYVIINVNNLKFSNDNIGNIYKKMLTDNVYKIIDSKIVSGNRQIYLIDLYDDEHINGYYIDSKNVLAFDKDKEFVKCKNDINKYNL